MLKRLYESISSSPHSGMLHPSKRVKSHHDMEQLSIAADCFAAPPSSTVYDFPDFPAQDPSAYPFFEFLGTGPADPHTAATVPAPAPISTQPHLQPLHESRLARAPTVVVSPISASPAHHVVHLISALPKSPFTTSTPEEPAETADNGSNSDSTNPDSSSSQRQADRAARNRESSRRAREKAKGRLRSLESEVLMLRDACRRMRAQADAAAKQRAPCTMCGFDTPSHASHGTKFAASSQAVSHQQSRH
jgi:hypothetical protein